MASGTGRSIRFEKFLASVLRGERTLPSAKDLKNFFLAIREQEDHSDCIERLIASSSALNELKKALRFDVTPEFINQHTAPFIQYLSDPGIKQVCNGLFLEQLLAIIVEPRTLWNAFLDAFKAHLLNQTATYAFAWLLAELLTLPASSQIDVTADALVVVDNGALFESQSPQIRTLGQKIKHILLIKSSGTSVDTSGNGPGGRHDNDFGDFRQVVILPTSDEFQSTVQPFYRRADEVSDLEPEIRTAVHLDNQFRLLREDMLSELREDLQIARGLKKGRRSAVLLRNLSAVRLSYGDDKKLKPCTLGIQCKSGLEKIEKLSPADRKEFLTESRAYLKHQAFGCLVRGNEIISFATIDRNMEMLTLEPPVVMLLICGCEALKKTLLYLKLYNDIDFVLVDSPIFAYEPILQGLQDTMDLPFEKELFLYKQGDSIATSNLISPSLTEALKEKGNGNIQHILKTAKETHLDPSQLESLLSGLTQSLSLIQGPPGTGKSFIGALIAKMLYDHTQETILVICYTNHALDQCLEDVLDIGIPPSAIVRLGSKSTPRTAPLQLSDQKIAFRRSQEAWSIIDSLKSRVDDLKDTLDRDFKAYTEFSVNSRSILEFLEFEDPVFYEALAVPEQEDGMVMVGRRGTKISSDYLYSRWTKGQDAGSFVNMISPESRCVWDMDDLTRKDHIHRWTQSLLDEHVTKIKSQVQLFDMYRDQLDRKWNERTQMILKSKRIIACTTTAAAKLADGLRSIAPGVILVEEAGEVLESHILTALSSGTKQLVLIGDHQQLRPKINSHKLSVEKGDGYDLNRSLFERLIVTGYPHTTLSKQHRMCSEISTFVRQLSYPDLQDAAKTMDRPPPRGLQNRVIFFNHEHHETHFSGASDRRDEGTKGSKYNEFEVEIVLQIVKYLGQQGYGTDQLVVLTPYLGQLHLLRNRLSKENDPVLNDLDSYDLVKAGLLSRASANQFKRPIRISTIDNYQGEESEIVIATLTRSNKEGDIGFMAAPQRLNVLLSRARNVLIMVGNAKTFSTSRNGKKTWTPFIQHLHTNGQLYDGLPVKCERHPQKMAILKTKDDFQNECPDGGCPAPCGVQLSCGVHECPSRCHQLADHSKMPCYKIVDWVCPRSHRSSQPCFQINGACRVCNEEDRAKEQKRQRDLELESERERRQKEYAQKLAEIQDEIAHERRLRQGNYQDEERKKVLQQYQEDLARLKATDDSNTTSQRGVREDSSVGHGSDSVVPSNTNEKSENSEDRRNRINDSVEETISALSSNAKSDWDYQTQYLGAQSAEIDEMMEMIGLEEVKGKFLSIKDQVDTALRQNVDIKGERFGSVLLGNPGTGKTTVARLYAKFLASIGVLPGSFFVETTGSRLANDGIPGCQKTIDNILTNGGGALFIDEAYQLVQKNNYGGTQVVNFLLAEIENLTGKIVIILAGYQRQMEEFFAHNPGLPSRFPHEIKFGDYNDDELLQILDYGIRKKYQGRMKIEGGSGGLYCRIVARRIGRGRGREGFGNARAVENARARIAQRQSDRLKRERRASSSAIDDLLLTKEDLIGPEPSRILDECSAWKKLQIMVGLKAVKETIQALLNSIQDNYRRELEEKPLVEFTLNQVFLGNPGTGKTTVAKLYGQMLADIGLLSNGEVVVKNPADFIGSALGESEKNTKGILGATVGKVLVLDEAYGLYGGESQANQYKTAVVDTIVAEVQSTPGDDRCVLLLGYKDDMEKMFQNVNPGLSRRFPIDSAFVFDDFTDDELVRILETKLEQQGFKTTSQGQTVAMDILKRARNLAHFGNAGEIDILLNAAKARYQRRVSSATQATCTLEAKDFDQNFDRIEHSNTNIRLLFEGVVACEEIVTRLEGYCETVKTMRQLDMDPREHIPFNFLFCGPPGTGKTSMARKMGKVYYDMGFLNSADVVDCSATDFIASYVGQTGPKTQKLLVKGLGKVLFIDEAYRLADGGFAQEAMDEIVDCTTKPKFAQRLIIILAGYDSDMARLMSTNPGLTSRFPESFRFNGLSPDDCITCLTNLLQTQKMKLQKKAALDLTVLERPERGFLDVLRQRFLTLSDIPNWANARDVQTLAKSVFSKAIRSAVEGQLIINETDILTETDGMIRERTHRGSSSDTTREFFHGNQQNNLCIQSAVNHSIKTETSTNTKSRQDQEESYLPEQNPQLSDDSEIRDVDVTQEVWDQLQRDKAAAETREKDYEQLLEKERAAQRQLEKMKSRKSHDSEDDSNQADDEAKKRHEQARLERELARREQDEELERIRKQREAIEQNRRKEQQMQKKLRQLGVCCAGFRWIKQRGGYRCAGGSHFVSDAQLDS